MGHHDTYIKMGKILKDWSSPVVRRWRNWHSHIMLAEQSLWKKRFAFFSFFLLFINFIYFLVVSGFLCFCFCFYFTILYWFCHTSTCIRHGCICVPHPEPPSHLPPHTIPLGRPSAPAPSFLYPASNLDQRFVSYMILYMF